MAGGKTVGSGIPKWREPGEKEKNFTLLRNISQKGTGGGSYRPPPPPLSPPTILSDSRGVPVICILFLDVARFTIGHEDCAKFFDTIISFLFNILSISTHL